MSVSMIKSSFQKLLQYPSLPTAKSKRMLTSMTFQCLQSLCLRNDQFTCGLLSCGFSNKQISQILQNTSLEEDFISSFEVQMRFKKCTNHLPFTAEQLHQLMCQFPKLIAYQSGPTLLVQCKMLFCDKIQYTPEEAAQLITRAPFVLKKVPANMYRNHEYLIDEMAIEDRQMLLKFPHVYALEPAELENRHEYLKKNGLAQYDPTKPKFISLKTVGHFSTDDFLADLGGSHSFEKYYEFLKTI